ncbi:MAG: tetratricopeptide repeat protein [Bacteroidota bacterium]
MTKFRFRGILLWTTLFSGLYGADCHAQDTKTERDRSASYYFRVGEVQLEKNQWLEARNSFDACLRKDHTFADAYYSRAIVHEHFDSLNQALTDYNIYLEFHPDHHEALFNRSQIRMRLDQYELAKSDLQKLLRLPRSGETTQVFFRQDQYAGQVDKVFTMQGGEKGYIYNAIGLVDLELDNYEEAIKYFDSAFLSSPHDPDLFVNRGIAKERKRDTVAAIADYQRALMFNPQHAVAKHNLATIGKGKDLAKVNAGLLDEAIDDSPNMPSAYAQRAYSNFQKGNFAKALEDYDKAIALDDSEPEYFLARGMTHERLNDPQKAYDDYSAAIKLKENFDKAYLNRGNILIKLELFKEAVDDYTNAIKYSPNNSSAYFNRALAFSYLNQGEVACDDLIKSAQLGAKVPSDIKQNICK